MALGEIMEGLTEKVTFKMAFGKIRRDSRNHLAYIYPAVRPPGFKSCLCHLLLGE